ncbi:TPA: hypothetical protein PTV53_003326 [Clostridium botulinum]|nr:hypothetical protein [Clostridium botulinum]HDK7206308.1 hypothetical protein [Clostridium botulinum]HDK7314070.1 hypothetical protein [Clostridium botulinum]HDK7369650.1 hypothetical protein [Clostridium botulinum]
MNFKIWHTLESYDWNSQENDLNLLLGTTINVIESKVDDEGIYQAKVIINSVEDLMGISSLLDANIVIYGTDSDILMTVKTMRELGLD